MGSKLILGRGTFGRVVLIDQHPPIAAKYIYRSHDERVMQLFEREWRTLKEITHHPNIVHFYGYAFEEEQGQPLLVIKMEYCERKALKAVIQDPTIVYNMKTVVYWAKHLFSALVHLEENKIVHRDLKPDNVLVTDKFVLKLCDFGCVRDMNLNGSFSFAGTARYMSPECAWGMDGTNPFVNYKSDLYGVGLILWEIIERRTVLLKYGDEGNFKQMIFFTDFKEGRYRSEPPKCDFALQMLQVECTKMKPEERPTAKEALDRLATIEKKYEFLPIIRENNEKLIRPIGFNGCNEEVQVGGNDDGITWRISPINIQLSPQYGLSPIDIKLEESRRASKSINPLDPVQELIERLEILPNAGPMSPIPENISPVVTQDSKAKIREALQEKLTRFDEYRKKFEKKTPEDIKAYYEEIKDSLLSDIVISKMWTIFDGSLESYSFLIDQLPSICEKFSLSQLFDEPLIKKCLKNGLRLENMDALIFISYSIKNQIEYWFKIAHQTYVDVITYFEALSLEKDEESIPEIHKLILKTLNEMENNPTNDYKLQLEIYNRNSLEIWFLLSKKQKLFVSRDFNEFKILDVEFLGDSFEIEKGNLYRFKETQRKELNFINRQFLRKLASSRVERIKNQVPITSYKDLLLAVDDYCKRKEIFPVYYLYDISDSNENDRYLLKAHFNLYIIQSYDSLLEYAELHFAFRETFRNFRDFCETGVLQDSTISLEKSWGCLKYFIFLKVSKFRATWEHPIILLEVPFKKEPEKMDCIGIDFGDIIQVPIGYYDIDKDDFTVIRVEQLIKIREEILEVAKPGELAELSLADAKRQRRKILRNAFVKHL